MSGTLSKKKRDRILKKMLPKTRAAKKEVECRKFASERDAPSYFSVRQLWQELPEGRREEPLPPLTEILRGIGGLDSKPPRWDPKQTDFLGD